MHRNVLHGQLQTAQAVLLGVPWAGIWARHGNAKLEKINADFKWNLKGNG